MTCHCKTYKKWREENDDFSIADLDFGTVAYDVSTVASAFDRFFNCWYINCACGDFAELLQLQYDLAKERIDQYYDKMLTFTPHAHTEMSVEYGKRGSKGYGYDYPVSGDVDTSAPNTASKSETDKVTDKTTVDRDDDPFKDLREFQNFSTFIEFFCDQFRDCFTLIEGVTW